VLEVSLWTPAQAQTYIERRVRLHQQAMTGDWPDCTPEERWTKSTKYALMKKGRKKAIKLYNVEAEALQAVTEKDHFVELRPGEETRCESYCGVSKHCPQFAKIQASKLR